MKTFALKLFLGILWSILLFGCEKDSDDPKTAENDTSNTGTGIGTIAISTLKTLPEVLGPVVALELEDSSEEAISARDFDDLALEADLSLTASTGAVLGEKVADLNAKFEGASNPSKAMCDITNSTMKFVFEMGRPDFMGCIIKNSTIADDETLYDGTDKKYKLSVTMDGDTMKFLVKLNLKKTGAAIEQFTFHSCEEAGAQWRQQQWFDQVFADSKMTCKSKMSGPEGSSISSLNVVATMNSEGEYIGLKEVSYKDTGVNSDRFTHIEVTQSSKNILFNSYSSNSGGTQYYAFYEIIDPNTEGTPYAITKLAIGDGASLVKVEGESLIKQGWNGDTFSINATEERLAKIEGKESNFLPAFSTENETYSGAELFDCSEEDAVEIELDLSAVQGCMERFEIDQEGSNFCTGITY